METVTVSADALRQVLNALNGPGHYIRELQVTRNPIISANNPINILCEEYNAAVEAHNASQKSDTEEDEGSAPSTYCTCNGEGAADEEELFSNRCKACDGQLV